MARPAVAAGGWGRVVWAGQRPSRPVLQRIQELSSDGAPWYVLCVGSGGTLVAWDDRLAILEATGLSRWFWGARFSGSVATWALGEVASITYAAAGVDGVLVVLPPATSSVVDAIPELEATVLQRRARAAAYGDRRARDDGAAGAAGAAGSVPVDGPHVLPLSRLEHQRQRPHLDRLRASVVRARSEP